MAEGLQQPAHAPAMTGRAEQHRYAEIFSCLSGEVAQDVVGVRLLVHQQSFEQLVVMIRQLLQQLGAGLVFAVEQVGGDVDPFGRPARLVMKGAFQGDVDEAGDVVALLVGGADRNLAGDQRRHAHRLQRGQQLAD